MESVGDLACLVARCLDPVILGEVHLLMIINAVLC